MLNGLHMQPWMYFVAAPALALLLFGLRSRALWLYGLLEICVGFALVALSRSVTAGDFSSGFSSDFSTVTVSLSTATYLGAIFVMVRGYDNINQGIVRACGA